jgi:hypothetical protein
LDLWYGHGIERVRSDEMDEMEIDGCILSDEGRQRLKWAMMTKT